MSLQTTHDTQRTAHYGRHTNTDHNSSPRAFGSGELKQHRHVSISNFIKQNTMYQNSMSSHIIGFSRPFILFIETWNWS